MGTKTIIDYTANPVTLQNAAISERERLERKNEQTSSGTATRTYTSLSKHYPLFQFWRLTLKDGRRFWARQRVDLPGGSIRFTLVNREGQEEDHRVRFLLGLASDFKKIQPAEEDRKYGTLRVI